MVSLFVFRQTEYVLCADMGDHGSCSAASIQTKVLSTTAHNADDGPPLVCPSETVGMSSHFNEQGLSRAVYPRTYRWLVGEGLSLQASGRRFSGDPGSAGSEALPSPPPRDSVRGRLSPLRPRPHWSQSPGDPAENREPYSAAPPRASGPSDQDTDLWREAQGTYFMSYYL